MPATTLRPFYTMKQTTIYSSYMRTFILFPVFYLVCSVLSAQNNADCGSAMDICKKQTYTISRTGGEGADKREADFIACFMNGENYGQAEENSTWIKFEIKQGGYLNFTITPQRSEDDLDFVVFRLPEDGDCSKKQIVRCMAAGDSEAESGTSRCMGQTGLKSGEKDTSEDAGCADADDNTWLAPLKVAKGEKYVLLVSNVSSSGPGFSISFGGSCKLPCDEEPIAQAPVKPPVKKTPPVAPKPKELPAKTMPPPATIGARDVRVTKTLAVKNFDLSVSVWDNQVEDGDVISLYLNDKKVIGNVLLTKRPQEFLLKMDAKEAYLTVYAEDFGLAEPNTTTVVIKDGVTEQTIVLKAGRGFQESVKVVKE